MSNQTISNPLTLPCGAILKHRLVKSAMSDSLGNGQGDPTDLQMRLYEKWTEGGSALSIIGEVQVDPRFPERPGNLVLDANSNHQLLKSLAKRASIESTHIWPQLGHAGALSHAPISKPKGPSALNIKDFSCEGMSLDEIQELPSLYAKSAAIAKEVGFTGVQIHAGHGFLFSQFLSPLFNLRTDNYGGSIQNRCRIITEVISKVRCAVGTSFPIGIKINSSDMLEGGLTQDDALEVISILDKTSVDLIDISGGTYFPGAKATSDSSGKGPYFLDFAKQARERTAKPLMLTGGFKTREQAVDAVESGIVDVVGLARALGLEPQLPNKWLDKLNNTAYNPKFPKFSSPPPGGITAWYTMRLTALAEDSEDSFDMDLESAITSYEDRSASRCELWKQKFL